MLEIVRGSRWGGDVLQLDVERWRANSSIAWGMNQCGLRCWSKPRRLLRLWRCRHPDRGWQRVNTLKGFGLIKGGFGILIITRFLEKELSISSLIGKIAMNNSSLFKLPTHSFEASHTPNLRCRIQVSNLYDFSGCNLNFQPFNSIKRDQH